MAGNRNKTTSVPSTEASNLSTTFDTTLSAEDGDDFDLNKVEVIDDLSLNRWLMRIMRLGASYMSSGSNGYNKHLSGSKYLSSARGSSRRASASESLLRPAQTSRGRRLSETLPGILTPQRSFKSSRRGRIKLRNLLLLINSELFKKVKM